MSCICKEDLLQAYEAARQQPAISFRKLIEEAEEVDAVRIPNAEDSLGLPEARVRLRLAEGDTLASDRRIGNSQDAVLAVEKYIKECDREYLVSINLSAAGYPVNYTVNSIGTKTATAMNTADIFKTAILSNANSIILLHNHPSGEVKPSKEDIDSTRALILVGHMMGIGLTDHIITAPGKACYSFRDSQTDIFDEPGCLDKVAEEYVHIIKNI